MLHKGWSLGKFELPLQPYSRHLHREFFFFQTEVEVILCPICWKFVTVEPSPVLQRARWRSQRNIRRQQQSCCCFVDNRPIAFQSMVLSSFGSCYVSLNVRQWQGEILWQQVLAFNEATKIIVRKPLDDFEIFCVTSTGRGCLGVVLISPRIDRMDVKTCIKSEVSLSRG